MIDALTLENISLYKIFIKSLSLHNTLFKKKDQSTCSRGRLDEIFTLWNIYCICRPACPSCQLFSHQQKKYQNSAAVGGKQRLQKFVRLRESDWPTDTYKHTHTHTWKHKYLKVDDKNLLMSEIMETKIGTIHPTALTRTVHSDRRLHFNFPQYRRGQEEFHTSNVQLLTYNIQPRTSNI